MLCVAGSGQMELAKIGAHGRTTIPKAIREAAGLREGDVISFEIEGDCLAVHKVVPGQAEYLRGLGAVMDEWFSPEDEIAWRDL